MSYEGVALASDNTGNSNIQLNVEKKVQLSSILPSSSSKLDNEINTTGYDNAARLKLGNSDDDYNDVSANNTAKLVKSSDFNNNLRDPVSQDKYSYTVNEHQILNQQDVVRRGQHYSVGVIGDGESSLGENIHNDNGLDEASILTGVFENHGTFFNSGYDGINSAMYDDVCESYDDISGGTYLKWNKSDIVAVGKGIYHGYSDSLDDEVTFIPDSIMRNSPLEAPIITEMRTHIKKNGVIDYTVSWEPDNHLYNGPLLYMKGDHHGLSQYPFSYRLDAMGLGSNVQGEDYFKVSSDIFCTGGVDYSNKYYLKFVKIGKNTKFATGSKSGYGDGNKVTKLFSDQTYYDGITLYSPLKDIQSSKNKILQWAIEHKKDIPFSTGKEALDNSDLVFDNNNEKKTINFQYGRL